MDKGCNIRFFDKELNFLGEVDNFTSLIFIRSWETYGEFTIKVSSFSKELFKNENIIMINNDPFRVGFIETVNADVDNYTKIEGFTLGCWLSNRITIPSVGSEYDSYNTNVETIMKQLVLKNAVEPYDPKRKIPKLSIINSTGKGEVLNFQTRYKYLSDELTSLAKISGLGWGIYLDIENKEFIFDVFEGRNLSSEQNILPPKIFGTEYDNVTNRNYISSIKGAKTTAIVAGQGEGVNREIQILNNELSGLARKEMFVDARDIEGNESLADRGSLKLAENKAIETFECETIANGYIDEWNLGDVVTILDKELGYLEHNRVVEIMESYESGIVSIEPTFGIIASRFTDRLREILNTPLNESNKIVISATEPNGPVGQIWIKEV